MTRIFIILGVILIAVGLLWPFISKLGLGHLPGDIIIKRQNFSFYFPLTTSILISIIVSVIFWIISKFFH